MSSFFVSHLRGLGRKFTQSSIPGFGWPYCIVSNTSSIDIYTFRPLDGAKCSLSGEMKRILTYVIIQSFGKTF